MKLQFARTLILAAAVFVTTGAHANEFVGDLVFCDLEANGVYEPALGDFPLNDVTVDMVCEEVQPDGSLLPCGDPQQVVTGVQPSPFDLEEFRDPLNCGDAIDYDPFADFDGRYIFRVPACTTAGITDQVRCRVAVDPSTLPPDCNVPVTPRVGGFPADGPPSDGDFCDPEDGPFPEGQVLGNLDAAGGCEAAPDDPPGNGAYNPVFFTVGSDRCSVPNDFGYTPPDVAECSIELDKTCTVIDQPPSDGPDCEDIKDITALSMIWNGPDGVTVSTPDGVINDVNNGEEIAFSTPNKDTEISVSGGGIDGTSKFHVSCSDDEMNGPEDCGEPQGNGKGNDDDLVNLWLLASMTGEKGSFDCRPEQNVFQDECRAPSAPPAPHCTSKLRELVLRYVGGECSVSNSQEGKASCSGGTLDPDALANVTITKDSDKVFAEPDSDIAVGDLVSIFKASIKNGVVNRKELGSETKFDVRADGVTQQIKLHTSCSKPLNLGDRFGGFEVFALDRKDDGRVSLGAEVEYQYTVTSPFSNMSTLKVSVEDDPDVDDGDPATIDIGSGISLEPGEFTVLFGTATLLESTTNKATAIGVDASGAQCMAMDKVTVEIVPPPPPPPEPFDCSDAKPIQTLSLIWNGQGTTTVTTEGDQVIAGVTQGQEVLLQVGGLGNDVDVDMSGFGSSRFHVSCSDNEMNGPEDCGTPQGNGKDNKNGEDLWIFEGMAGDLALDCSEL